jgi:dGTPase
MTSDEDWKTRWPYQDYAPNSRPDTRDKFQQDRARILHSSSFRRLQSKTQIIGIGEGDFHRTRLTHTMEVGSIVLYLRNDIQLRSDSDLGEIDDPNAFREALPPESLLEAIAFCHDLGHPPFGHSGEEALNYLMRASDGFEGNGQSIRIATRPHLNETAEHGLSLTRRTMLGFLKYPVKYTDVRHPDIEDRPPKCYLDSEDDVVTWILARLSYKDRKRFQFFDTPTRDEHDRLVHGGSKFKSLDASFMDLADELAYAVHDIEDGIHRDLVQPGRWRAIYENQGPDTRDAANTYAALIGTGWFETNVGNLIAFSDLTSDLFTASIQKRKWALGGVLNALVRSARVRFDPEFAEPVLRYNIGLGRRAGWFLSFLKRVASECIHESKLVKSRNEFGRAVIEALFDDTLRSVDRLREPFASECSKADTPTARMRIICDYIANVTDSQAVEEYKRLYA